MSLPAVDVVITVNFSWFTAMRWYSLSLSAFMPPWWDHFSLFCLLMLLWVVCDCLFVCLFVLAVPCGLWNLSFPTRDWTYGHQQWKRRVLTTGPPLEFLMYVCVFIVSSQKGKLHSIHPHCWTGRWPRRKCPGGSCFSWGAASLWLKDAR